MRSTGRPATALPANLRRDQQTVSAMVHLFCYERHTAPDGALCSDCSTLHDYAFARLEHCPFGESKTTCRVCPIHCYRSTEREAMRDVMRVAGPKMLLRHPWLAVRHLWIERQGPPPWPPAEQSPRRVGL